jgi:hypothetical protein
MTTRLARLATPFCPVSSFFCDRCAMRPDVVDLLIHVHLAAFFFAVFFSMGGNTSAQAKGHRAVGFTAYSVATVPAASE